MQKLVKCRLFPYHCTTDMISFNLIPNIPTFCVFMMNFSIFTKRNQKTSKHDFCDARGDEKQEFLFVVP